MLLFIRWLDSRPIRRDPDLQKMRHACFAVIEFAVRNASARTHALHVAWLDRRAISHAVFVRQCAIENVADDLHVPVAVLAEAHSCGDAVFVDYPQRPEAHMLAVVIIAERKTVMSL